MIDVIWITYKIFFRVEFYSASVEPNGVRLVEVHQPLSEKINDDPQLLPIVLNASMQTFKNAAQTDSAVMEHAMEIRSGMPVDVTRHHDIAQQPL